MIQIVDNQSWRQSLDTEIARLEALLTDLQRLRDDRYPTDDELAAATVILNPTRLMLPAPCMAGYAVSHPVNGSKPVRTSMVEVLGPGWFRSSNRLYRIEIVEGVA